MNDLNFTLELIGRVFIAAFCGVLIGYERRNKYKVAGVKTHMTVGLGAGLMMVVSKYGFGDSGGFDASRVAAQIVSGVGFLGAGIIFKKNQSVHGLTTAAGIWTTAAVGMAIGAGLYIIGIVSTVSFMGFHFVLQSLKIFNNNGIQETYSITVNASKRNRKKVLELCDELKLLNYVIDKEDGEITLSVSIVFEDDKQKKEWIEMILSKDYIHSLEFNY